MAFQISCQTDGLIPVRASEGSAGYDLCAPSDGIVPVNGDLLVNLRINIALPKGHYAQIWPRSGIDLKRRVTTGAGIIDEDYRGDVCVLLRNFGDQDYSFKRGDRIAQMIIMEYKTPPIMNTDDFTKTSRGTGGFGSTGTQ